jgi:hypothetical protein
MLSRTCGNHSSSLGNFTRISQCPSALSLPWPLKSLENLSLQTFILQISLCITRPPFSEDLTHKVREPLSQSSRSSHVAFSSAVPCHCSRTSVPTRFPFLFNRRWRTRLGLGARFPSTVTSGRWLFVLDQIYLYLLISRFKRICFILLSRLEVV